MTTDRIAEAIARLDKKKRSGQNESANKTTPAGSGMARVAEAVLAKAVADGGIVVNGKLLPADHPIREQVRRSILKTLREAQRAKRPKSDANPSHNRRRAEACTIASKGMCRCRRCVPR